MARATVRVDRGLYRLPEARVTELHSLVEVAKRVPHATIALLSALQAHGLTTPAKTVADCFRYRRHVGLEVALAALRAYLRRRVQRGGARRAGSPVDDLAAAARAGRVSAVLRPYLEALA